jgi:dipeptide/tripeptide permease
MKTNNIMIGGIVMVIGSLLLFGASFATFQVALDYPQVSSGFQNIGNLSFLGGCIFLFAGIIFTIVGYSQRNNPVFASNGVVTDSSELTGDKAKEIVK